MTDGDDGRTMADTRLPSWATFNPLEVKGTRLPTHIRQRLTVLANLPLSLRQKAKLTHRSMNWVTQFATRPDTSVLLNATLEEAISLFKVIGYNCVSSPFLSDQIKQNVPAPTIQKMWGLTRSQAQAAIDRAKTGHSKWW